MRPAALLLAFLLAACTAAGSGPYPPVPAPIPEAMPLPPVAGQPLIWQPGHWDWTGASYGWTAGQYVPLAGHGRLWMREQWSQTPGGWQWQPAHWVEG